MKYYVFKNDNQKGQISKLESFSDSFKKETNDFKENIIELVSFIRENKPELAKKAYMYQIFSSANQIVYSYKLFKEAKADPLFEIDASGNIQNSKKDFDKQEESMALVFFINAKAFLELVKNFTSIERNDDFNDLFQSITIIRNYFAHYYEKDFEKRKCFINLWIQRGIHRYSILEVTDMKTEEGILQVCFSFDAFYFSLKDIFLKLKNNPNFLKQ